MSGNNWQVHIANGSRRWIAPTLDHGVLQGARKLLLQLHARHRLPCRWLALLGQCCPGSEHRRRGGPADSRHKRHEEPTFSSATTADFRATILRAGVMVSTFRSPTFPYLPLLHPQAIPRINTASGSAHANAEPLRWVFCCPRSTERRYTHEIPAKSRPPRSGGLDRPRSLNKCQAGYVCSTSLPPAEAQSGWRVKISCGQQRGNRVKDRTICCSFGRFGLAWREPLVGGTIAGIHATASRARRTALPMAPRPFTRLPCGQQTVK
jgi:hypothetical protein